MLIDGTDFSILSNLQLTGDSASADSFWGSIDAALDEFTQKLGGAAETGWNLWQEWDARLEGLKEPTTTQTALTSTPAATTPAPAAAAPAVSTPAMGLAALALVILLAQ